MSQGVNARPADGLGIVVVKGMAIAARLSCLTALLLAGACVPEKIDRMPDMGAAPQDLGGVAADAEPKIDMGQTEMDAGHPDAQMPIDMGQTSMDAGPMEAVLELSIGGQTTNWNGASHDFGTIEVGQSSNAVAISIENTGNAGFSANPMVSGSNAFSLMGAMAQTISAGQRMTFSVLFSPTADGAAMAQLNLGGNYQIQLRGQGMGPTARNIFVAVGGDGRRVVSSDGITWRNDVQDPSIGILRGVTIANGQIMAVGSGSSGGAVILRSNDGINWTRRNRPGVWIGSLAYGNNLWVAAGNEGFLGTSDDNGASFTQRHEDGGPAFRNIAFGNGVFVAVGDNGRRMRSTDGINWTNGVQGGGALYGVTYGGGSFVATGFEGRITVSPDGINWTEHNLGSLYLSVAYGNGRFVAVGSSYIAISTDGGANWQRNETTVSLSRITFGQGIFVATGDPDTRYSSTDGLNWTQRATDNQTWFRAMGHGSL